MGITPRRSFVEMTPLMTPTEVSEVLIVPEATLAKWRYEGTGPAYIRVGKHVRYPKDKFEEWLKGLASPG
jgi:excisionase family DNA binding protein